MAGRHLRETHADTVRPYARLDSGTSHSSARSPPPLLLPAPDDSTEALMIEHVDPFIGSSATDLPAPVGLAATWWWPKPQVGNTHPGATYPFGMVSACAYSGAYPTGYGLYELNTEGVPPRLHDEQLASGFTHFQQSGTGAIRKYYNYFRVTPMLEPLDALGTNWPIADEEAEPGLLRLHARPSTGSAERAGRREGIRCELTVGPKSAVHRYTFPAHADARLVIDFSMGGLAIPYGTTVPLRAHLETLEPGRRPRRDRRRGHAAGDPRRARRRRLAASCSGTTAGSCRAAPGWTSTGSGRRRCARSA